MPLKKHILKKNYEKAENENFCRNTPLLHVPKLFSKTWIKNDSKNIFMDIFGSCKGESGKIQKDMGFLWKKIHVFFRKFF